MVAVAGTVVATVLLSATFSPAIAGGAGGGGGTQGGYQAVAFDFRQVGGAGGGGHTVESMPSRCWWSVSPMILNGVDVSADPSQWLAWRAATDAGSGDQKLIHLDQLQKAITAAATNPALRLYRAACRDGLPCVETARYVLGDISAYTNSEACNRTSNENFYPQGAPPQPSVDPRELALKAVEHLNIPNPLVDRNPLVGALGGATLVDLPTWFWVRDDNALAASSDGRLEIIATAGRVQVMVTATTVGLTLASEAGGSQCSIAQATTAFGGADAGADPCAIEFRAASVGRPAGFAVTASSSWTATWLANDGTSGALVALGRVAVTQVPVAETQALVSGP
ncbi:MAG: hypothetical protein ABI083_10205 [Lapillicoccus sp.]